MIIGDYTVVCGLGCRDDQPMHKDAIYADQRKLRLRENHELQRETLCERTLRDKAAEARNIGFLLELSVGIRTEHESGIQFIHLELMNRPFTAIELYPTRLNAGSVVAECAEIVDFQTHSVAEIINNCFL